MVVGVAIVQRQSEKWPYHDRNRRFTTKTNANRMRSMLFNRTFGFTSEGVYHWQHSASEVEGLGIRIVYHSWYILGLKR